MSTIPLPIFKIKQFENFPYFFSVEEVDALEKWGKHAEDLSKGNVLPISSEESQFVAVAKGNSQPTTRFQCIWLRYLQAVKVEQKIIDLGNEIVYLKIDKTRIFQDLKLHKSWEKPSDHQSSEESIPTESLTDKIKRLDVWGKSAWRQLEDLKTKSATEIRLLEAKIIALQNKYCLNSEIPENENREKIKIDIWDGGGNEWREQK